MIRYNQPCQVVEPGILFLFMIDPACSVSRVPEQCFGLETRRVFRLRPSSHPVGRSRPRASIPSNLPLLFATPGLAGPFGSGYPLQVIFNKFFMLDKENE
ncbi:hypothetical protein D7024_01625 [Desulfofundulus salinus]|uniref:Uncharacterized protein n=1 Tax=Desulfofundulus salinus TaxID=2419843 RepID=A0A494WSR5_9FIRM|nr:hypothetical protein D7024_01625 [Desulfofundulus salinum]